MRDLQKDLEWLSESQNKRDLSDEYLKEYCPNNRTREDYKDRAPDFSYGITFVESTVAREWLKRAITAEELLKERDNNDGKCNTKTTRTKKLL